MKYDIKVVSSANSVTYKLAAVYEGDLKWEIEDALESFPGCTVEVTEHKEQD